MIKQQLLNALLRFENSHLHWDGCFFGSMGTVLLLHFYSNIGEKVIEFHPFACAKCYYEYNRNRLEL